MKPLVSLLAATVLVSICASAQDPSPATRNPRPAPALTAQDLGAFLDGSMTAQLKRDDIAGAVICVVKDGKVLYEMGYGYADASRQVPVSPQDTLFRAGSISKLFAATAVMQLVEDGRLDLDQDIESYLDFRIPATYPQPITLRHLLTHTAGFEEVAKDLFSSSASPLEQYVKTHIPARIYAPGTIGAYSNYGAALAGYIVQRISREPVDQYVANHVFNPLAMSHSTFTQPLPSRLARFMSSGYQVASGGPKPFEYISASPAGALSVSGDDIAHFVIAQLQNGRDGDPKYCALKLRGRCIPGNTPVHRCSTAWQ